MFSLFVRNNIAGIVIILSMVVTMMADEVLDT